MANAVQLDWATQRFTGLTGAASVNWQPFTMSNYGITTMTRFVLDIDAFAITTNDLGASYNDAYLVKQILTYDPSIPALSLNGTGSILNTNGGGALLWSVGASSANPVLHVAGAGTLTNTYDVFFAAKISAWLFR